MIHNVILHKSRGSVVAETWGSGFHLPSSYPANTQHGKNRNITGKWMSSCNISVCILYLMCLLFLNSSCQILRRRPCQSIILSIKVLFHPHSFPLHLELLLRPSLKLAEGCKRSRAFKDKTQAFSMLHAQTSISSTHSRHSVPMNAKTALSWVFSTELLKHFLGARLTGTARIVAIKAYILKKS